MDEKTVNKASHGAAGSPRANAPRAGSLRRVPLFSSLPAKALAGLAAITQGRHYKKGEHIFFEGDPGDAMFVVEEGAVKVYRLTAAGKEKTLAVVSRGECLGEMSLLDALPRSAAAQALEDTMLLMIPREGFLSLLVSNPEVLVRIIRVLTLRLREANQQIEYLAFGDARSRVASILLDLLRKHAKPGPHGHVIDLRLTHQELASLSGVARETVSRILADFEEGGLVQIHEKSVVIVNESRLHDLISL